MADAVNMISSTDDESTSDRRKICNETAFRHCSQSVDLNQINELPVRQETCLSDMPHVDCELKLKEEPLIEANAGSDNNFACSEVSTEVQTDLVEENGDCKNSFHESGNTCTDTICIKEQTYEKTFKGKQVSSGNGRRRLSKSTTNELLFEESVGKIEEGIANKNLNGDNYCMSEYYKKSFGSPSTLHDHVSGHQGYEKEFEDIRSRCSVVGFEIDPKAEESCSDHSIHMDRPATLDHSDLSVDRNHKGDLHICLLKVDTSTSSKRIRNNGQMNKQARMPELLPLNLNTNNHYMCGYCKKTFRSPSSLHHHVSGHQREESEKNISRHNDVETDPNTRDTYSDNSNGGTFAGQDHEDSLQIFLSKENNCLSSKEISRNKQTTNETHKAGLSAGKEKPWNSSVREKENNCQDKNGQIREVVQMSQMFVHNEEFSVSAVKQKTIHLQQEGRKTLKGTTHRVPSALPQEKDGEQELLRCNGKEGEEITCTEKQPSTNITIGMKKKTPCKVCGKMFATLNRHMLIHTGEYRFECFVCHKTFRDRISLTDHMGNHSGEKPCKCMYCKKAFQCPSYLRRHVRTVHEKKNKLHMQRKLSGAEESVKEIREKTCYVSLCVITPDKVKSRSSECCEVNKLKQPGSTQKQTTSNTMSGNRRKQCKICGQWNSYLSRHMLIHTGIKPHKCSICGQEFRERVDLKNHMYCHSGKKEFKCAYCIKTFYCASYLRKHMNCHTRKLELKEQKKTSLPIGTDAEKRNKMASPSSDTASGNRRKQCMVCGQWNSFMSRHMLIHTGINPHKCSICGQGFRERADLTNHMYRHSGKKQFKCTYCLKTFYCPSHLRKHLYCHKRKQELKGQKKTTLPNIQSVREQTNNEKTHNILDGNNENSIHVYDIVKDISCLQPILEVTEETSHGDIPAVTPVEAQQSSSIRTIENIRIDTDLEKTNKMATSASGSTSGNRKKRCQVCGKWNSFMSRHMLIHTGIKPQKCSICGQAFRDRAELADHLYRHSGKKQFKCAYCVKAFYCPSHLRKHMYCHKRKQELKGQKKMSLPIDTDLEKRNKMTSPSSDTASGSRRKQCWVCGKWNSFMSRHMLIHTGMKPHECSICGQACRDRAELTDHLYRHSGKKQFKCAHCVKTFYCPSHLRKHMCCHRQNQKLKGQKKTSLQNIQSATEVTVTEEARTLQDDNSNLNDINKSSGNKRATLLTSDITKDRSSLEPVLNVTEETSHVDISVITPVEKASSKFTKENARVDNGLGKMNKKATSASDAAAGSRRKQCKVCGKWNSFMSRHMLIHTGLKPYKCSVCGQAFRERAKLTDHMYRHSGKKEFKCRYCVKTFYCPSDLQKHKYCHKKEQELEGQRKTSLQNEESEREETSKDLHGAGIKHNYKNIPDTMTIDKVEGKKKDSAFQTGVHDDIIEVVSETFTVLNERGGEELHMSASMPGRNNVAPVSGCTTKGKNSEQPVDENEQAVAGNGVNSRPKTRVQNHVIQVVSDTFAILNEEDEQFPMPDFKSAGYEELVPTSDGMTKETNPENTVSGVTKDTSQTEITAITSVEELNQTSKCTEEEERDRTGLEKGLNVSNPSSATSRRRKKQCKICGQWKSWLNRHMLVHTGLKPYTCSTCHKSFKERAQLTKHMRFHPERNQYVCGYCAKTFPSSSDLDLHITSTHKRVKEVESTSSMLTVEEILPKVRVTSKEICNKKVPDAMKSNHIKGNKEDTVARTDVQTDVTQVFCHTQVKEMKKQMFSQQTAQKEEKRHVTERKNNFQNRRKVVRVRRKRKSECTICGKMIVEMGVHMLIHGGEKRHKCNICGKTFFTRSNCMRHMLAHTDERKHQCEYCGKNFKHSSHLKLHLKHHTGDGPCTCAICGTSFKTENNLKRHMNIHNRVHQCSECGKMFSLGVQLKTHMRTHTGEMPYKCTICGSAFARVCNLRLHERMHTGEKPFKCNICGKAFRSNSNMLQHRRTHTGEKKYKCELCGKSFTQAHTLKSHKYTHSGEGVGELRI